MYIDLTPEEKNHLESIKKEYAPQLSEITKQEIAATDETREGLIHKRHEIYGNMMNDVNKYIYAICKIRFEPIAAQGVDAILENAEEQTRLIIENIHKSVFDEYKDKPRLLKMSNMGIIKNNNLYLNTDWTVDWIIEELSLHVEALQDHEEALNELYNIISTQLKNSPLIDHTKTNADDFPGQLSIFDYENFDFNKPKKPKEHKKSALKQAEDEGAVTTIGGYLTSISDKKYQLAFTSKINKYAYLINGGEELFKEIIKDSMEGRNENEEYDGILDVTEENEKKLKTCAKQKPVDELLISAFFSAIKAAIQNGKDQLDISGRYISVYLPKFCRELGVRLNSLDNETAKQMNIKIYQEDDNAEKQVEVVDTRKNDNDFWTRLNEIKSYIGVLKSNGYIQFMNIVGFNAKTQILYLDFPYLNMLNTFIKEDEDRTVTFKKDKTKVLYEKSYTNELLHSTVVSARNKAGAAIAKLLIDGVLQRGGTLDAKLPQNQKKKYSKAKADCITYRVSCYELVNNIPAFKYRLENIKSPSTKNRSAAEKSILDQQNKALKNAFTAAYKILRDQSDLYKYFVDVEIDEVIPTMRQLKNVEIEIRHKGKNPKYKKA